MNESARAVMEDECHLDADEQPLVADVTLQLRDANTGFSFPVPFQYPAAALLRRRPPPLDGGCRRPKKSAASPSFAPTTINQETQRNQFIYLLLKNMHACNACKNVRKVFSNAKILHLRAFLTDWLLLTLAGLCDWISTGKSYLPLSAGAISVPQA
jgi:hypothetical protein